MNLIDLAILLLFGFVIIFSMYRGFLNAALKAASTFVCWIVAAILHPLLAWILGGKGMISLLAGYTEGARKLLDNGIATAPMAGMGDAALTELVDTSSLVTPYARLVNKNLLRQSFAKRGLTTVGEYFDTTVAECTLNILCFVLLFVTLRLICGLIINMIDHKRTFPVLVKYDTGYAAICGFIQGFLVCYVVFALTPMILSIFNVTAIVDYINSSFFGSFFYKTNVFLFLVGGT